MDEICGIPISKLAKRFLIVTQDKKCNETLILKIFEVLVARLLCIE